MKKIIKVLWSVFGVCIVIFIASVFLAKSSGTTWRVFSFVMPIASITLCGAIILTVLEHIRSNKKKK